MPFPSDSQYVPLSLTALPSAGEAGSANPAYVDVVGTPSSPAAYYGYDGTNVYFRIRLKGDPRFKSVFRNAYWGVLFDTDGQLSAYEWLLRVNGTDHSVELVRNRASRGTGIAAFAAIASGTAAAGSRTAIVNFDIARAKPADDRLGLRGDYFIDFYVNAGVLFGELGLGAASPLRLLFFSAETENGAGNDLPASGTGALSNEVAISGGNVRAELSVAQTLNGAPFPQDLPAGPQLALSGTIQVANTGRSAATALFANTLFQIDRTLVSFTIDSVSAGSATFTSSNLTLSWTVGNLGPGVTTVDVALAPLPGSIAGSVTDSSTGGPIEDACVRVYNSDGLTIQTARTDGNGRYEVGSLAPGAYNVLFNDTGYANRTVGAFVRARTAPEAKFKLAGRAYRPGIVPEARFKLAGRAYRWPDYLVDRSYKRDLFLLEGGDVSPGDISRRYIPLLCLSILSSNSAYGTAP